MMEIFTLAMLILFGVKAIGDLIELGDVSRYERGIALRIIIIEALFSLWAAVILFKEQ